MEQLIHNGVLIPRYEWKRFRILMKGIEIELTPEQEEMAVAWVRKLGTDYVKDKVFVSNFFKDFCKALDLREKLGPEDFDFCSIEHYLERQKEIRLSLPKQEKKRLREQRKAMREANSRSMAMRLWTASGWRSATTPPNHPASSWGGVSIPSAADGSRAPEKKTSTSTCQQMLLGLAETGNTQPCIMMSCGSRGGRTS